MILRDHDLTTDLESVYFDAGMLHFSVRSGSNELKLLIVEPRDPDYLAAITWAIQNNRINQQ